MALNCGAYDAKGYILSDPGSPIHYYVGELTPEKLEAMDKYVTSGFPPAYIILILANKDFLLTNAQPMYDALRALGIPAEWCGPLPREIKSILWRS